MTPRTLLYLDVDGTIPRGFFCRVVHWLRLWRWPVDGLRLDRTARGWHVVIQVRRTLVPAEVVAAQAILGSDRNREGFNLMRVQGLSARSPFWQRRFNVLYSRHIRHIGITS